MFEVKRYLTKVEADLDKALLEANGIKVYLEANDMGGLSPHLTMNTGAVLFVYSTEDKELALKLLAS